jgi:hypothetical protein
METVKSDYYKGLIFFVILAVTIVSFFQTPDGENLFFKFLGLFNINPYIRLGGNGKLYVISFIPVISVIICIRKILQYWQGYGVRFNDLRIYLRYFPLVILVFIFLLGGKFISPRLIDRAYYAVIGSREGVRAVTYHYNNSFNDTLRYTFSDNAMTYHYDLTLHNHGNDTVSFNMILTHPYFLIDHSAMYYDFEKEIEIIITDDSNRPVEYVLPSKTRTRIAGSFTARQNERDYSITGGEGNTSSFHIILTDGETRNILKPITNR